MLWSQGGAAVRQITNLLHWGRGNASLRQMPAWEGGQGPRDRAGSKAEAAGACELTGERVWREKADDS